MLFNPGKMTSTSRLLFEQNIAMTIVGFPATALLSARARVCISASHTRQDLDWALQVSAPPPLPSPPVLFGLASCTRVILVQVYCQVVNSRAAVSV